MLNYDSNTQAWNKVFLFPIMPSLKYTLDVTITH